MAEENCLEQHHCRRRRHYAHITGTNGAAIDGNDSTQLFSIAQSATLLLNGLQLKHGRADRGAAVYAATGAVLTISNCEFSDNFAELQGGAVAGIDSNVSLTNCTFRSNSARQDGKQQVAYCLYTCID
eukprot:21343-Heterococcus_DN1.PRE.2